MHLYERDGKKYPSVTTIVHSLGSDDITRWSNFLGFKHIKVQTELDRTASFGTLVHSHLQHIVDPSCGDELVEPKNSIEKYDLDKVIRLFNEYFDNFEYTTLFTERFILSEELGYAGTMDWVANVNGKIMLNDFKTAKAPYISMMFQLGGYYNLLQSIGQDVDLASIITINTSGCKMHPIHKEDLIFYAEVFNSLAKFYIATELYSNPKPKIDYDILTILQR